MSGGWRLGAALCFVLLAGCVSLPGRKPSVQTDAGMLAGQAERERLLAGIQQWSLSGRIAISDAHNGYPGSFDWQQRADDYVFVVRVPVTGKSFRLTGDPSGAELEGVGQGVLHGASAEELMLKAAGWQVPLSDLRAWVRGARAEHGPSQLSFGADGLPVVLQQDGWRVEYRAWDSSRQPALPTKVFAEKPPYKVRLSIESWQLR